MVDIVDKVARSRMMSGIRSSNTKPEVLVRKALHSYGFRYSLKSKIKKIKPDIVLPKYDVAIFVHGCYWHQHNGCKLAYSDRKYNESWLKKFKDNKERDRRVVEQLINDGWYVAVIWECATRDTKEFKKELNILNNWIKHQKSNYLEFDYHK